MISFHPTEDQKLMVESVAQFARVALRPKVRETEHARGLPESVRKTAHELGLGVVALPESVGGAGLGLTTAVLLEEELAWGDPAAPFALAGPGAFGLAVVELGTAEQARDALAPFASDGAHARFGAVAWGERKPNATRPGFSTTATRVADGWQLDGAKAYVLNADRAEHFVVFAQLAGAEEDGWRGTGAFLVHKGTHGLTVTDRTTTLGLDAASFGGIELSGAVVPDSARLLGGTDFTVSLVRFFAKNALVMAARSVGLSRAAFEITREYVDGRKAFGKPIGHFQAVAFTVADRAMDVDASRGLVWRAAAAWDAFARNEGSERDALLLTAQAVAFAHEAAMRCGDDGVQLHGGAGFMRDYPVEKLMRDAKQLGLCGMTAEHADQLAAAIALDIPIDPGLVLPDPRPKTHSFEPPFRLDAPPRRKKTMTIEFSFGKKHLEIREAIRGLGKSVIRPQALAWDRNGGVPEDFLRNMTRLAASTGSNAMTSGLGSDDAKTDRDGRGDKEKKKSAGNLFAAIGAEEISWADPGLLLCLPGPGLGGPPVRSTGTPEQKKRFFSIFENMLDESTPLRWGAYGLTEPAAGSDVASIRTTARKDGKHWVLNGRKCYITNGARASWTVIFATIDPSLGRAGHRAFVVEKGTPGFAVGRIEEKMGLRASETAELVLEDCRVPEENLLGGEEQYVSKEGFMTAMKTFDNTRPLVAAMALGIGRAAYEYAAEFVKKNYVLSRPVPRYAAIAERLARVGRGLEAARTLTWRAAWMADEGEPNAKEASMSKAMAGQAAIRACIEAIEICGAEGSIAKDHQLLEKWFRDIKVYDIFEGTGQIQRIVISKRLISNLKSF